MLPAADSSPSGTSRDHHHENWVARVAIGPNRPSLCVTLSYERERERALSSMITIPQPESDNPAS